MPVRVTQRAPGPPSHDVKLGLGRKAFSFERERGRWRLARALLTRDRDGQSKMSSEPSCAAVSEPVRDLLGALVAMPNSTSSHAHGGGVDAHGARAVARTRPRPVDGTHGPGRTAAARRGGRRARLSHKILPLSTRNALVLSCRPALAALRAALRAVSGGARERTGVA